MTWVEFTETRIRVRNALTDYTHDICKQMSNEITKEKGKVIAMNSQRYDERNDEGALINKSIMITVAYEVKKSRCLICNGVFDGDKAAKSHSCSNGIIRFDEDGELLEDVRIAQQTIEKEEGKEGKY